MNRSKHSTTICRSTSQRNVPSVGTVISQHGKAGKMVPSEKRDPSDQLADVGSLKLQLAWNFSSTTWVLNFVGRWRCKNLPSLPTVPCFMTVCDVSWQSEPHPQPGVATATGSTRENQLAESTVPDPIAALWHKCWCRHYMRSLGRQVCWSFKRHWIQGSHPASSRSLRAAKPATQKKGTGTGPCWSDAPPPRAVDLPRPRDFASGPEAVGEDSHEIVTFKCF